MLGLGALAKVFVLDHSELTLYCWQVHPARKRWGTALLTSGLITFAAWLVVGLMEQPSWGVFAVVVLVVGCNRFFFPTRYEIDNQGITARFPLRTVRYQWVELRRFLYDHSGGFLSPRIRRSPLDEYRGISLLFPDDAQSIIQEIQSHLPTEALIREVSDKTGLVAGVDAKRSPQKEGQDNELGLSKIEPRHASVKSKVVSREGSP